MTAVLEARSLRDRARRTFLAASIATIVAGLLAVVAVRSLLDARRDLVDRVDPATLEAERLLSAAIDQETGVRAYLLAGVDAFLEPYRSGLESAAVATGDLRVAATELDRVNPGIAAVDAALLEWQDAYAEPTIEAVDGGDPGDAPSVEDGRELFDAVRTEVQALQTTLLEERSAAKDRLDGATYRLVAMLGLALLVILGAVGALWRLLQRSVQSPLDALGADAYVVAGGDLEHPVTPVGPHELQALAAAMEQMRLRLLAEATDLRRSNAELEQFAYVASHDLQEPLRKVASFCQLLQQRYGGQLDERADQYIEFAVDGAKRMQALINDLLAFSRVGRVGSDPEVVDGDDLLARALANLATTIEETGAEIESDPLPPLEVEVSLVVALLQNLVANAIKFRREGATPHIRISVESRDGEHEFAVHDDGIGIEPEYAERVFVIFQRLHTKEAYEGTGIGLAMCRKIVERHGGRIWVESRPGDGSIFRFTLPR